MAAHNLGPPIGANLGLAGPPRQQVSGLQLADALVDGAGRRHIEARQVLGKSLGIAVQIDPRMCRERMNFRGESEAAARERRVHQRLDAEAVAGHKKFPRPAVPKSEGEHPDQTLQRFCAVPPQQAKQYFGVALGAEALAFGLEFGAQLPVVVDFAVVGQHVAPTVGNHRLGGGGAEVDDGEAGVGETDAPLLLLPQTLAVRSPVRQAPAHGFQYTPLRGRAAGNPTHV